ncbi:MAG: hypothetical protein KUG73_02330, partial [Pseudomonadales bacterium]|nr:hypothetical protein [Pseudomonadales bacterium]
SLRAYRGQTMIAGMGLMLVASSVIFMLFNSNRAVTEKINLVNAADAVAYSGALVASRELNFMAYTNRTMIANEVAIGHMVSFQSEVSLVTDVFSGKLTGLGANIITAALNVVLNAVVGTNVAGVFHAWEEGMSMVAGTYIVATDATNAMYGEFEHEEYEALIGSGGKGSIIESAMTEVAQRYVKNPDVQIVVNDSDEIDKLIAQGVSADLEAKLTLAKNGTKDFCYMILFATPGDPSKSGPNENGINNSHRAHCDNGANTNGTYDKPLADVGVMLDLIQQSSENVNSSEWITDRNRSYESGLAGNRTVDRAGSSSVVWENDAMNWKASDTITSANSFWNIIDGGIDDASSSADAKAVASSLTSSVPWAASAVSGLLAATGWCGNIDCDEVKKGQYNGIQSYAMINPLMSQATIRVALTQKGNCNDLIGRDDDSGVQIDNWHDDQARYCTNCDSQPITAYSSAQVYYGIPECSGTTCTGFATDVNTQRQANLFNPFWHARLAP